MATLKAISPTIVEMIWTRASKFSSSEFQPLMTIENNRYSKVPPSRTSDCETMDYEEVKMRFWKGCRQGRQLSHGAVVNSVAGFTLNTYTPMNSYKEDQSLGRQTTTRLSSSYGATRVYLT